MMMYFLFFKNSRNSPKVGGRTTKRSVRFQAGLPHSTHVRSQRTLAWYHVTVRVCVGCDWRNAYFAFE